MSQFIIQPPDNRGASSLAILIRAGRIEKTNSQFSKLYSDPPHTLVETLSGIVDDSRAAPRIRADVCFTLGSSTFNNHAPGGLLTTAPFLDAAELCADSIDLQTLAFGSDALLAVLNCLSSIVPTTPTPWEEFQASQDTSVLLQVRDLIDILFVNCKTHTSRLRPGFPHIHRHFDASIRRGSKRVLEGQPGGPFLSSTMPHPSRTWYSLRCVPVRALVHAISLRSADGGRRLRYRSCGSSHCKDGTRQASGTGCAQMCDQYGQ